MSVLVETPLTSAEIKNLQDTDGYITVPVDICDLLNNDTEGFNDLLEERILVGAGVLGGTNYHVVGTRKYTHAPGMELLLEVSAEVLLGD